MIKNAMNKDLKDGLWSVSWRTYTDKKFEHIVICSNYRLKSIQVMANNKELPIDEISDYFDNWGLTKAMNANAKFLGEVSDNPEYFI